MINKQGWAITGMFPSAPKVGVVREAELHPVLPLLKNSQRRYGYSLLAASPSQHTVDIVPVTMCEGEEQAPLGQLAEGDDNLFKPKGEGRETRWQQLVWMVAKVTVIDTSAGTECTEWV